MPWEERHYFRVCKSLNVQANRGQLDSSVCFCIQFVATCVLAELYDENLASHRNVVRKGSSVLMAFADNYGYLL